DARSYLYGTFSRRLTEERLNLNSTSRYTNTFAYDAGASAGAGVLTRLGDPAKGGWSGTLDPLLRVTTETNSALLRSANGRLNGKATVTALLDGTPLPVTLNKTGDPLWTNTWRSTMELTPGAHLLAVSALHPSGLFVTNASIWFTNSGTSETVQDNYN